MEAYIYICFVNCVCTVLDNIENDKDKTDAPTPEWAKQVERRRVRLASECGLYLYPASTTLWLNAGMMLGQRRRRWANINPALVQSIVFAGNTMPTCGTLAVYPADTRRSAEVSSMLGQTSATLAHIEPTSTERLVFEGYLFNIGRK